MDIQSPFSMTNNMASVNSMPEQNKSLDGPSVTLTIRLIMQGKVRLYFYYYPFVTITILIDLKLIKIKTYKIHPQTV